MTDCTSNSVNANVAGASDDLTLSARSLKVQQTGSRSGTVEMSYDYSRPLFVHTKGIHTANLRITKDIALRREHCIVIEAVVTSPSTTVHNRLHASSQVNERGEYAFVLDLDWSIWDLGMTRAELTITLPAVDGTSSEANVHPGIRAEVPNGAIGATMLGNTLLKVLDLATGNGPAHLSDVAANELRLTAHNGNITVHDVYSEGLVEIKGQAAWMDIDDVHAGSLVASSVDAVISLKDIVAKTVSATTKNARIGLGNVKADVLTVATTSGEVVAQAVFANVCDVKATKGSIEGCWNPGKKLFLATSQAKISAQVVICPDSPVEIVVNSSKGPIELSLPASFTGGFMLETTGYYKTFVHVPPGAIVQPVLHISKPDTKAGTIGDGSKRHSLRAITTDAPVSVNFGCA